MLRKLFYGKTKNGRMLRASTIIMPLVVACGLVNYLFGEGWYSYILYGLLAISVYFGFFHKWGRK